MPLTIEAEGFVNQHRSLQTQDNKTAVVRSGYLPERTIQTGLSDLLMRVFLHKKGQEPGLEKDHQTQQTRHKNAMTLFSIKFKR